MSHMTAAEREHWDHEMGAASDMENAFALGRMGLSGENAEAEGRIRKHLDAGLFVVTLHYPAFCPSTDAYTGEHLSVGATASTLDFAEKRRDEIACDCDPEMRLEIRRPKGHELVPEVVAHVPANDNDVPF